MKHIINADGSHFIEHNNIPGLIVPLEEPAYYFYNGDFFIAYANVLVLSSEHVYKLVRVLED